MFGARSPEEISREMEFVNNPQSSMSSTMLIKSVVLPIPARLNETKEELKDDIAGIDQLPHVLQNLCLDYEENPALLEDKIEKKIEKIVYPHTTFLKKTLAQKLHEAADDLLLGYGKKALDLVKQYPWVIECKTTGSDRFGRCIKERTLLQMAAMAGDVNLRDKKPEEKEDHGLVELLAQAGKLSQEEIANQLFPVLFSEEAKKENEARKNAVLAVLKEFGESLIKRKADLPARWSRLDEFKAAQAKCKREIDTLRKDLLRVVSNQTITAGYILDSQIIVDFAQWFEHPDNFNRFGGWDSLLSDLFWVTGYGSLQYVAAARDAQVHREGIGSVVDQGVIPSRTLKNSDNSCHFSLDSLLGLDFYLGYFGAGGLVARFSDAGSFTILCQTKTTALQNLCSHRKMQSKVGV